MSSWLQPLVSIAVLVLPSFLSPPTQAPEGLISQATLDYIESIRLKYDVPGVSIGIIASPKSTGDGWKNETHGFGYMNSQGRAVDGDTLFAIASNSKHFASISIGLLIANGTVLENGQKLNYDTKIKDILPDWHMVDSYMEGHLDVLDLLSMRSGMPAHNAAVAEEDPSKIVARFAHLRPSTEVRQIMQYNNIHYWIIAEIVAHITKGKYTNYVKVNILDPIGLNSSTYNHTEAKETAHASESFFRADQNLTRCAEVWAEQDKLDRSCYGYPISTSWFTSGDGLFMAGCGGLVSSANDLVKWLKELLEPTVIPKHIIAETHKSFIPAFTRTSWDDVAGINNYGQGQMTYNYRGHEVIYHYGNVPGFGSVILRLPALGVGFFLAINDDQIGNVIQPVILYRLLDDIIGLEAIDWEERFITSDLRKKATYNPLPDKPRSAPATSSLIGKYFDEGYGSLELLNFQDPGHSYMSGVDGGADPKEYLQAISTAMAEQPGLSDPVMFAHIGKLYGSVYVYSHFDGPVFNVTTVRMREHPKGELTAYIGWTNVAVFVEGKGMGMFQNFWGGEEFKSPVEHAVKDEAEVWFGKDE